MSDFISTSATTELEAINMMLQSIAETPVNSLEITGNAQIGIAKSILSEVNREVQTKGWWFNEESEYPLAADTDGHVHVPTNAVRLLVSNPRHDRELVQRGDRLYDTVNHTYKISETVKVDVVFLLPFKDLPQTAKDYIAIRAARRFQSRQTRSRVLHALTQEHEMTAKAEMNREDLRSRRDTMHQADAVRRVISPNLWRPTL